MSGGGNGGPPNKWTWFAVDTMSGDEVGARLNDLAAKGYTSVAVSVECDDGTFVFVGGYAQSQS